MCHGHALVVDRPLVPARPRAHLAPRASLHLRGTVLPDGTTGDVFVTADGRVTLTEQPDATTVVDGGWLLPGLADVHAHLALASPAGDEAAEDERIRASLGAHLDAGVLLVREPGSPTRAAAGLGPDGGFPRVLSAGRFLAPPGRYFPGLAREVTEADLADAVEEEARHSGAWVKIVGDFIGDGGRLTPNYSTAAITDAVARAHAAGARVAVHVMGRAGMDAVVEAGVDTIEHGHGITDDHIAAMVERNTTFVPTMSILVHVPDFLGMMGLTQAQVDEAMAAVERHPEMVNRAAAAGLRILAGTDAGMVRHGTVGREVGHLLDAGLPAHQAIGAASWDARRYLGLPGIEEGAPADIVAFDRDPRDDPTALAEPTVRILDGRVVTAA
jgi:imidazolonepropionase-like amidohydrolase